MQTHFCSFTLYENKFNENKNNYIYSGFLSPRIAYIRKGKCEVKTENGSLFLKEGTLWYLPRFYPYSSHWTADPEVNFDAVEFELDSFGATYRELQIFHDLPLLQDFDALKTAVNEKDDYAALSAFYHIVSTVKPLLKKAERDIPQSVVRSVDFITANYKSDFHVADLAKDCFLSESRFYYMFKKATGFSPVDFRNYLKISHAVNSLQNGNTLEEICEEYEFCSPAFFRRLLKKFTGKSPSEFKKEYRKL